ncbi:MAG: DUF427 domain-containing protein [Acidimicrobiales bacterium]
MGTGFGAASYVLAIAMSQRPEPFPPGPGQESVWDYPRPPRIEPAAVQVEVVFAEVTVAVTFGALRVLETSHPPAFYLPPDDVVTDYLTPNGRRSWCEWKGGAKYLDISVRGHHGEQVAWTYTDPLPGYEALTGYIAFYPARVDACLVHGELVLAQPGGFYGGWITTSVVGPFKGAPGSELW